MENKRMVMIPGPTPVVKSIQDQMGREIQAFGDPRFVADYKEVISDLGKILNCSGQVFCIAGTGTLAMEMAISNTTKSGDSVLLVSHGFFW
jgi:aspartate aminotransferase-like enzyme